MRIAITSVLVEDQDTALSFYTEVLGFVKKRDLPAGEFRWLTVVSAEAPDGVELLLEPNANPAGKQYKQALLAQGIPAATFAVDDIRAEFDRMTAAGVVFTMPPTQTAGAALAVFDDTCGNLIQLFQA